MCMGNGDVDKGDAPDMSRPCRRGYHSCVRLVWDSVQNFDFVTDHGVAFQHFIFCLLKDHLLRSLGTYIPTLRDGEARVARTRERNKR